LVCWIDPASCAAMYCYRPWPEIDRSAPYFFQSDPLI
jgi:hypothetical protein